MRWTQGSIIFQGAQHALDPVIRVGDQIEEAILAHGLATRRAAAVRARVELLEKVGLPATAGAPTSLTSSRVARSSG